MPLCRRCEYRLSRTESVCRNRRRQHRCSRPFSTQCISACCMRHEDEKILYSPGHFSVEESQMAHKQVLFRSEAREKLLRGLTALADAVRIALENAVSAASLLRLAEATLTELPEPMVAPPSPRRASTTSIETRSLSPQWPRLGRQLLVPGFWLFPATDYKPVALSLWRS
jgi:hypothetical protein